MRLRKLRNNMDLLKQKGNFEELLSEKIHQKEESLTFSIPRPSNQNLQSRPQKQSREFVPPSPHHNLMSSLNIEHLDLKQLIGCVDQKKKEQIEFLDTLQETRSKTSKTSSQFRRLKKRSEQLSLSVRGQQSPKSFRDGGHFTRRTSGNKITKSQHSDTSRLLFSENEFFSKNDFQKVEENSVTPLERVPPPPAPNQVPRRVNRGEEKKRNLPQDNLQIGSEITSIIKD